MNTAPNEAQYSAAATFYAADGTTTMTCPFTSANPPSFVRILSTGSSEGEAAREVEAFGKLTPVRTGFGAAIMAVNGTTFNNNFTVYGSSGNNGDIYILNGNLNISNSPTVYGNVYVPLGTATLGNNCRDQGRRVGQRHRHGDQPSMVAGNAKSTAGNISGSGTVRRQTPPRLGTTTVGTVGGSRYPGTNPGPVPTQTFPQITNSTTAWTNAGYTLVGPFTGGSACTNAYNYIHNTGGGTWATSGLTNIVVQISATCTFQNGNNDTNTIRGNLAVISDGGFTFSQQSNWKARRAPVKNVYFISGYTAARLHRHEGHHRGQQHELRRLHERVLLHALHREHEQHEQLHRPGAGGNVTIGNKFTMTYKPVAGPRRRER